MLAKLYQIRADLATFYSELQKGMEWYKQEMDKLQNELQAKDRIIKEKDEEIKKLKDSSNK